MIQVRWFRWLALGGSAVFAGPGCSGDVSPPADAQGGVPSAGTVVAPPLGPGAAGTAPFGSPSSLPSGPLAAPEPAPSFPPIDDAEVPKGTPGTSIPYEVPEAASPALEARTWKLTHRQYQASIEQLLGIEVALEDEGGPRLAPETSNGVFLNLSDSGFVSVANGLAEGYMEIAEEVAAGATEAQLAALGGCASLARDCPRDAYLTALLGKGFRRPATADDLAGFGALFDAAAAESTTVGDAAFAHRSVLKALLTSPYFLYRTELGTDPNELDFQLTPHEVASLLSYSILGRPPSADLLELAAQGTLVEPNTLIGEVGRLLAMPEADEQFEQFMAEWLEVEAFLDPDFGLGRDEVKLAAGFDDVKAAMLRETQEFLQENGTLDGTFTALLTAPVQTSDAALAAFYESEPTGASAPRDRVGIFALGAGLSMRAKDASTSPTLRGLFVRERLLCQHFTVPPGVNPDLSDLEAQAAPETTRELYELHALDPTCSSCHVLFDPLGFTLETFDEVGRFRSTQNGVAIDTSATLVGSDVDQELTNHIDLANALAESTWARECLARQAFRYYFGTTTSLELDETGIRREEHRGLPPIQAARAALSGQGDLRAMVTALFSSQSTLARTRREPEQL